MDSKHLIFTVAEEKPKTKIFLITSKFDNTVLGNVYWYSKWRQYIFEPYANCVWSSSCLDDLSNFIKELMQERKAKK